MNREVQLCPCPHQPLLDCISHQVDGGSQDKGHQQQPVEESGLVWRNGLGAEIGTVQSGSCRPHVHSHLVRV